MNVNRRNFIKSMTAAGAVLGFGGLSKLSGAENDLPIGIQLYTVREKLAKDFKGTLKKVAKIGYKNFEFAGYGGMEAADLVSFLDEIGAKTCGTHEGYEGFLKNVDHLIEFNRTLGTPYIVVPSMPGRVRGAGVDEIKRFADNLNKFGYKVKQAGMQLAYHNHYFEFKKVDGDKTIWDVLFTEADADMVKAEIDVAWIYKGGVDPVAHLDKWGDRIKLLHMKDLDAAKKQTMPVGEGVIDLKAVVNKAKEIGVDWYIVEQDRTRKGKDIMDEIGISFKNLSKLLS